MVQPDVGVCGRRDGLFGLNILECKELAFGSFESRPFLIDPFKVIGFHNLKGSITKSEHKSSETPSHEKDGHFFGKSNR